MASIPEELQLAIDRFQPGAQRDRFITFREKFMKGVVDKSDLITFIMREVHHSISSFADTLSEAAHPDKYVSDFNMDPHNETPPPPKPG